jgi:alpha-N-arabinofuranosidase
MKKLSLLVVFVTIAAFSCLNWITLAAEGTPRIIVSPSRTGKVISPELFGAVIFWGDNAEGGFDKANHRWFPEFVEKVKECGLTSLRYAGGTVSATCFDWKRAIGPVKERKMNRAREGFPGQPSTVGPDEFGKLLEMTGAKGVVIGNFSRSNAQDQANYLAYLTTPVSAKPSDDPNDPSYWAALRAKNGHPAPYTSINWFDVGNEEEMFIQGWRKGEVVEIGAHTTPNVKDIQAMLYAFGGTTRFTKQAVVGYADLDANAAKSKGTANQVFYASYPPVKPGTQTVYVNNVTWKKVDNLATAGAGDLVYTLDDKSGKITFGDGTHGAIPENGYQVTISYDSGPHDGFVQYYKALKKVNPEIKVAAQYPGGDFYKAMGTTCPYDGVAFHPLGIGFPATNLETEEFAKQEFLAPLLQKNRLSEIQGEIAANVGDVPLIASAYGHVQKNLPQKDEEYHLRLIDGLIEAEQLMAYAGIGIPLAHRFLLNDKPYNPNTNDSPSARRYNAMIISNGTTAPFVSTSAGLAQALMSKLAGKTIIDSRVKGNPQIKFTVARPDGFTSVVTLSTLAVKDSKGNVDLVVVNRNLHDERKARVAISGLIHNAAVTVTTLNGDNYLSLNDLSVNNNTVALTKRNITVGKRSFNYTFPAHSVTLIHLTKK